VPYLILKILCNFKIKMQLLHVIKEVILLSVYSLLMIFTDRGKSTLLKTLSVLLYFRYSEYHGD